MRVGIKNHKIIKMYAVENDVTFDNALTLIFEKLKFIK